LAQPAPGFGAGPVGVTSGRALGAGGISGQDEAKDLPMLGPHQWTLFGIVEHSSHRAFQMRPLCRHGVFNRAVAGQTIERSVKRDIGLDERQHGGIRLQLEPRTESPLGGPLLLLATARPAMRSAASRAASASSALRTW